MLTEQTVTTSILEAIALDKLRFLTLVVAQLTHRFPCRCLRIAGLRLSIQRCASSLHCTLSKYELQLAETRYQGAFRAKIFFKFQLLYAARLLSPPEMTIVSCTRGASVAGSIQFYLVLTFPKLVYLI